ncbi:hypothetical protein [Actinomyces dentalis]|uniref:hypothetical protein n=1 Tax=Actinomyces dentalis TaxID=272548 RepID=UPI00047ADBB3|nr:hypothetical protein [Actinomyces dentalis]
MVEEYLTADDFAGLSRGGLAEACLACSARLSPMFAAFATRSDPRDYDDLVRDLWACAGREVSPREAEEFERRMEAFPEVGCDDSYLLDYYAMSVMGIPLEALHVLAGGGVERALACSELALELLGGFRVLLGDEKSELWDAERQEQLRVIAGLRTGRHPTFDSCLASPVSRILVEVLPGIVATQRAEQDEYLARIRHQE